MFRSKSFSQSSFSPKSWVFDDALPPKKPDNGWLGGGAGLRDYQKSAEAKRAERESLGIIPEEVTRAVEIVARIEARNPVAALENERQAIEALARELEREGIPWNDTYADLLRTKLRRLIDEELARRMRALIDEQGEEQVILLMLSEM